MEPSEQEIFDRVVKVIVTKMAESGKPISADQIKMDSDFIKDLGADSLTVVELVMGVEDEFGLDEIPESEVETIRTVGDVVAHLSRQGN